LAQDCSHPAFTRRRGRAFSSPGEGQPRPGNLFQMKQLSPEPEHATRNDEWRTTPQPSFQPAQLIARS
jgi:hypothetical protein